MIRQVEKVKTYKYLGCIMQEDLKWDNHITPQIKKCNKKLFLLRQLSKLKVEARSSEYATTPWYPVLQLTSSAHGTIATLLHQLARIEKQATKLIGKQDHQTLLMPASVYKMSDTVPTNKIMVELQSPLHSYFKWLPSGIRLSFQYCRTNWHKDTAVPSFIWLFNEYVTKSCQDEFELDPQ